MASAHPFSEFKDSKLGEEIALAAALVLPVVGLCCLLFPHQAQKALPHLPGIPMVVSGIGILWGLIGLSKATVEFNEIADAIREKRTLCALLGGVRIRIGLGRSSHH